MNAAPLIIVPKMVPPGGLRPEKGEKRSGPTCERCFRVGSDRNPVSLMERPAWGQKGPRLQKDALCFECRQALKS